MLRWSRRRINNSQRPVLHVDALSSVSRSILGLTYQYGSLSAARTFAHAHFLSRKVDLQGLIKFIDPKQTLLETVRKFSWERPVSRLLKETGRYTHSPVFVVGIFSGEQQLGEGFGSSLKMAEYRAAEDALHRLYLTKQPPHLITLPTSAFASPELYKPGPVGESEALHDSAGRGGPAIRAGRGREFEAASI
jgi:large subunit ribosomal protein L44